MIRALILAALLLIPTEAFARDDWMCKVWGNCLNGYARPSYRQRQMERQRAAFDRRIQREEDILEWERCRRDRGYERCGTRPYVPEYTANSSRPQCIQMVTAKGGSANTETGALNQAKRAWRSAVRADHGEIFIDLLSAKDLTYRCWRASTNESVLGAGAERVAGTFGFEGYQKRCQIWARGCQAPRVPLKLDDKDERD